MAKNFGRTSGFGIVQSMRETRSIMGMPITLVVPSDHVRQQNLDVVFEELTAIDAQFSPFKHDSEISRLNRAEILAEDLTARAQEIFALCRKTKRETAGYFDIARPDGTIDPCGMVKGWAINNAARQIAAMGFSNFCVAAGGDIQCRGVNDDGGEWRVGIRNPFKPNEIVKVLVPKGRGVATSGNYIRGNHIYNPHTGKYGSDNVVSLTVIGTDVLEADRYATAAFAMGREGIYFIERMPDLEGYEIDTSGTARMTSGLRNYFPC